MRLDKSAETADVATDFFAGLEPAGFERRLRAIRLENPTAITAAADDMVDAAGGSSRSLRGIPHHLMEMESLAMAPATQISGHAPALMP